jgi:hypothetical protein
MKDQTRASGNAMQPFGVHHLDSAYEVHGGSSWNNQWRRNERPPLDFATVSSSVHQRSTQTIVDNNNDSILKRALRMDSLH